MVVPAGSFAMNVKKQIPAYAQTTPVGIPVIELIVLGRKTNNMAYK